MLNASPMPLTDSLKSQLTSLVASNRVVLFMKGDRRSPMCGFSATVVGILDEHLPSASGYDTVNCLASPELRDGIKEFSDWPTIPQLYIDGKFVGGCDIVREMHSSGELAKLIGGASAAAAPAKLPTITLSESAAKAFRDATPDDGDRLHLAIDARFSHELFFGPVEKGELEVVANGVTFLVDPQSARRADGVSIDFVGGANGGGFKIENPNEPPRVRSLTARELRALMDKGTKLELFDVRTPQEMAIARIDGARPFDNAARDHIARLADSDKAATLVFHCHHGVRSRTAAESVVALGLRNVFNLEGGIEAWSSTVDANVPRY